ncbi:hypothetical protein ESW18_14260 [Algoriphagus ratkowskyi]|uniref:Uncharacterized protein n=1 Tax=Algoriphagus ratkowskyi TaxID=57028 RepID=A0ABY3HNU8_9BACT|nr:hypothetical protein ESW18_14260 [Algoriphagus ratkowskyi]
MLLALYYLLWFLLCISILSLLAGLVRPVYVLWFLDRMNRLKVLKIYGCASLILLSILFIWKYFLDLFSA